MSVKDKIKLYNNNHKLENNTLDIKKSIKYNNNINNNFKHKLSFWNNIKTTLNNSIISKTDNPLFLYNNKQHIFNKTHYQETILSEVIKTKNTQFSELSPKKSNFLEKKKLSQKINNENISSLNEFKGFEESIAFNGCPNIPTLVEHHIENILDDNADIFIFDNNNDIQFYNIINS
jgi:hypothetical protein